MADKPPEPGPKTPDDLTDEDLEILISEIELPPFPPPEEVPASPPPPPESPPEEKPPEEEAPSPPSKVASVTPHTELVVGTSEEPESVSLQLGETPSLLNFFMHFLH